MIIRPREVEMVFRVPCRVPLRRHTLRLAVRQPLRRETLGFLQLLGGFDHGDGQAGDDVPFHVAMQDPDARVVRSEPHHGVAAGRDHHGVALHGDGREGRFRALVFVVGSGAHVLRTGDVDSAIPRDELHHVAVHV